MSPEEMVVEDVYHAVSLTDPIRESVGSNLDHVEIGQAVSLSRRILVRVHP